MSLMGLDIGTTGCKAVAFSESGKILASSYKEYNLVMGKNTFEINPYILSNKCLEVIKEAALKVKSINPVEAISIASFGEAFVPISKNGQCLDNAIIYMDSRGTEESVWLSKELGDDKIFSITGIPNFPAYSICKMLWYKNNKKEVLSKAYKLLLIEDFILNKLGINFYISYSLASRTMAFNVVKKEWSDEILGFCGIDKKLLSKPVPSGEFIGYVDENIAKSLGLEKRVKVFGGAHDQVACAVGAGVFQEDKVLDSIGTLEVIGVVSKKFLNRKVLLKNKIANYCFIENKYFSFGFLMSGGSIIKWARDEFYKTERKGCKKENIKIYELMDKEIPQDPTNILLLPHFAGSGTPSHDPFSMGAILGLTIATKRGEIFKSILEGISYEIRSNIDVLRKVGFKISSVNCVGGGSKSDVWLQLKADIYGIPINKMYFNEGGCLGLAIIMAKSLKIYKDIDEAIKKMVKVSRTFYPNEKNYTEYLKRYKLYKKIYTSIKEINNGLSSFR